MYKQVAFGISCIRYLGHFLCNSAFLSICGLAEFFLKHFRWLSIGHIILDQVYVKGTSPISRYV